MTAAALPAIDGDACLLDRTPLAGCDACTRACPTAALRPSAEGIALVTELCTSCGACGAACPARAITVKGAVPVPLSEADRSGAVVLVCPVRAPGEAGTLCVQSLGPEALAVLWLRGIRRLWLETGACPDCPSGQGQDLAGHLEALNELLADRGLPGLAAAAAEGRTDRAPRLGGGPDRRRRGLLGLVAAAPPEPGSGAGKPALARLQGLGKAGARFAHVPVIDPQRCVGCHVCARLCPDAAVTLADPEGPDPAYRIDAARCTGCGLCVAACEDGAVRIDTLARACGDVPLRRDTCRGCGVGFHRPTAAAEGEGLCPICAKAPHFRKLHQVLG